MRSSCCQRPTDGRFLPNCRPPSPGSGSRTPALRPTGASGSFSCWCKPQGAPLSPTGFIFTPNNAHLNHTPSECTPLPSDNKPLKRGFRTRLQRCLINTQTTFLVEGNGTSLVLVDGMTTLMVTVAGTGWRAAGRQAWEIKRLGTGSHGNKDCELGRVCTWPGKSGEKTT